MSVAGLILSVLLSHFTLHIFRGLNGQANLMYLRKRKKHAGKAQDRDTLRFFLFFVFLFYYFPFAVFKNYIFLKN